MTPKKAAQELSRLGGFSATTLSGGYHAENDPAIVAATELSKLLEVAYYGKDTRRSTHDAYVKMKQLIDRMKGIQK